MIDARRLTVGSATVYKTRTSDGANISELDIPISNKKASPKLYKIVYR